MKAVALMVGQLAMSVRNEGKAVSCKVKRRDIKGPRRI